MTNAPVPEAEPRDLSSRATLVYKLVLPFAVLLWSGVTAMAIRSNPEARGLAVLLGAGGLGIAVLCGVVFGRIQRVRLVGDALDVVGLRRTLRVPLSDVARVSGTRFSNPERIFLDLRAPGPLGARIVFIPPLRWLRGFAPHPLVAELAARVDAVRAAAPPAPIAPSQSGFWRLGRNAGLLVLALAAFVAIGEYVMRSSPAYRTALAQARASRALADAIGEPMREGWLVDGSIRTRGANGTARFEFDLVGPRGAAKVHAELREDEGAWTIAVLRARVPGHGEAIDVAAPP